jgi:hypothetical protein
MHLISMMARRFFRSLSASASESWRGLPRVGTEVLPWYCYFENWVPAVLRRNRVGASDFGQTVRDSEPKTAENGRRP